MSSKRDHSRYGPTIGKFTKCSLMGYGMRSDTTQKADKFGWIREVESAL